MTKRTNKQHAAVFFKGMAMGAADVVPGVSGGTIAFITGIYEELINSLKNINPSALKTLLQQGPKAFWLQVNGNFLCLLLAGILTSFVSFAHLLSFLLAEHAIALWAFFFGLVLASTWLVGKSINFRCPMSLLALLVGFIVAFAITLSPAVAVEPTLLKVYFAGALAICAMVLPGISGSFILLLLGLYAFIIEAIKGFDIAVIAVFAMGCATGLFSFVHLLSWLLKRFHSMTIALLTGFLAGSLNALWPWKQVLSSYQSTSGKIKAIEQTNVLPATFERIQGLESNLGLAIATCLLGLILVVLLEKISQQHGVEKA